jgi:type VI secretion system protein ImpC
MFADSLDDPCPPERWHPAMEALVSEAVGEGAFGGGAAEVRLRGLLGGLTQSDAGARECAAIALANGLAEKETLAAWPPVARCLVRLASSELPGRYIAAALALELVGAARTYGIHRGALPDERLVAEIERWRGTELGPFRDELLHHTGDAPSDYRTASVADLLEYARERELRGSDLEDRTRVDVWRTGAEVALRLQIDEILHAPAFQALESAWRGLQFLIERIDFRENVRLAILDWTKDELREDLRDDPQRGALGRWTRVRGDDGTRPYGAVIAMYGFDDDDRDVDLLDRVARLAESRRLLFIANANASFFGLQSFTEMRDVRELEDTARPSERWRSFRASPAARSVALCAPRFQVRDAYRSTSPRAFGYFENASRHEDTLWAPASIALGVCIARSFAAYRWCPSILGPIDGATDLPTQVGRIPIEAALTDGVEYMVSELGFAGLTYRSRENEAVFFSANTAYRPIDGFGKDTDASLSAKLPYAFVVTRIAHYLESIALSYGAQQSRETIERALNEWLKRYVVDLAHPPASIRARRPFRRASVVVEDGPDETWWRYRLTLVPHFMFMGASFTLALEGEIER